MRRCYAIRTKVIPSLFSQRQSQRHGYYFFQTCLDTTNRRGRKPWRGQFPSSRFTYERIFSGRKKGGEKSVGNRSGIRRDTGSSDTSESSNGPVPDACPLPTHPPPPSLPVSGATQIINFYQSSGRTKTERSRFCVSTHGSPSVSRPRPVVENYIARASISRRCAECPSECCAFRAFQFF